MKIKRAIISSLLHILLAFITFLWIIPIIWLVVTAFSGYRGIDISHFFPETWSTKNFGTILFKPDSVVQYVTWFKNTFIIAVFTCIISTVFIFMVG